MYMIVSQGSLEVKLSTIWTYGKAKVGIVREEKERRKKIREERESERERESQSLINKVSTVNTKKYCWLNKVSLVT